MNDQQENETINEQLNLNLAGKMFLSSLGAWLVGKNVNTKLRGSKEEVQAIANALLASRRFYEELRRPGASIQTVNEKLSIKQMAAARFKKLVGISWPL